MKRKDITLSKGGLGKIKVGMAWKPPSWELVFMLLKDSLEASESGEK